MDLIVKIRLFASSYVALFLILAIRWYESRWLALSCLVMAALGLVSGAAFFRAARRVATQTHVLAHVQDRGPEVAGYLASYLLPFVTALRPNARDLIGYGVFLFVAGVVYVKSEMLQINPTFYLLGWTVVSVETETGYRAHLLTRGRPRSMDKVRAVRMGDEFLIERPETEATDGRESPAV